MKKLFSKMMLVTMAVAAFVACEDVPEPYDIPGTGNNIPGTNTEIEGGTGDGTLENPFNPIAALNYGNKLASGEESPTYMYVKGKVVDIAEQYTTQYGNARFTISEDGSAGNTFLAYRVLYLGNKKFTANDKEIKIGDDVIVCGIITNYNGTVETAQNKGFLYSLNGENRGGEPSNPTPAEEPKGEGTQASPFNVAAALKYTTELGSDVESDKDIYIKGKVSKITNEYAADNFGNATFYISDDGNTSNEFYCYRTLYLGNTKYTNGKTQINVGDEVIVCCKVVNFKGNTPETVQNKSYLYSLNGVTEGGGDTPQTGEAKGSGTLEDPYNATAANAFASALAADAKSDKDIYIKGKIIDIEDKNQFNTQYGNCTFYISDDGTDSGDKFYVYRTLYLGNVKYTSGDLPKKGDEVIICGKVTNYRGNTPETVANESYIYSLNGKTEGGGGGDTPNPGGEVKTVTIAEFNAAEVSNDVWYQLTGKVTNLKDGDQYGNFDLVDETGSVYVYGLLSEKGGAKKLFQELVKAKGIKEGSTITIIGNRGDYQGKIEVMNAYFVSIEGGGGGDTPGQDNDKVKKATISEFNAAEVSNDVWYQLTGTVKNLKDGDQYGNFDLEDETGSVYVYGLLSEKGGEKKKFQDLVAAKGIKEGCKLTIIGNRGEYQGKIEVLNAYFVSIEGGGNPGGGGDNPGGGGGEVSGNTITIDFTSQGYENAQDISTVKLSDGTTLTFNAGENKNGPKYYNAGTAIRMYPKNYFTVTATKKITSIVLNCSENNAEGNVSASPGSVAVDGMTVSIGSVNEKTTTITNAHTGTGATSQLRIKSLSITYAE